MTLLSVRGLARRPWFENRELELERGAILVVRGPSGSGKTLFLRALADLDPIDAGEIRLDGRQRREVSPCEWRSRVTYLHQTPVRLPGSVAENIERIQSLAVRSGGSGERRAVQVPGVSLDAAMETLSGGEAQRVALFRALALGPDVLLLDEATSALDEDAARIAEGAVLEWTRAGGAALWVAHDPALAARLSAPEVRLA